jgi:hypothetical protein
MPSIQVTANVRGKRYEVTAETVADVCQSVEEQCGIDSDQQSILFRGKLLKPVDKLEDIGVAVGDTLNVVKGKRQRPSPSKAISKGLNEGLDDDTGTGSIGAVENSNSLLGKTAGVGGLNDMMGGLGGMGDMSPEKLQEAMKNVNPEDMQKAMSAMDEILDSDFVDEYFGDEQRLENARQQMLDNLDQYDQMMPGFKEQAREIASDPEKWKQAMQQARDQIMGLKQQRDSMRASGMTPQVPDSGIDDFGED